MDCRKADEYINLYVDGLLGREEQGELFAHIKECRACEKELKNTERLKKALASLGEAEPPRGLSAAVLKKARRRFVPALSYAAAGLTAAAALVLALTLPPVLNRENADTDIAEAPESAASFMEAAATEAPKMMMPAAEAAPAPAASEAPQGYGEDSLRILQKAPDSLFVYEVPAGLAAGFKPELMEFLAETGIDAQTLIGEDSETVSFIIPQQYLPGLIELVNKSRIPHDGEPEAGNTVRFVFEK